MDTLNISDIQVLADIGAQHGFDRDEVIALLADGNEHAQTQREVVRSLETGVCLVPHFVFDGRVAINGGRSEDELSAAISSASQGQPAFNGWSRWNSKI